MKATPLSETEIQNALQNLSGWELVDPKTIVKTYDFPNFVAALAFVNQVGELAEAANHHPPMKLFWGKVEVELTTHEIDALSKKDIALAQEIEAL